jgi:4-amino-4-deoxy-L-arabinose transferase-like glycosyltransferase
MDKIKSWIINNRLEAILLATILLVAAFLRLYKIDQYMTFLGDEGRDVIVVRRLLVNLDLILVGPGTSIGNMYLGPLYYYMIAPFLFIANFSPVGPAVMVALLGILTVFFVWFVTREWFGKLGGIVAALLYAISPVVIMYSRSSWNPNIMPFFSLLCIYSIWRVYKALELKWLIVLGFSFAMVLNSHYLGLLLVPVIFIYWVFAFLKIKKESKTKQPEYVKSFLNYSLL